MIATSLSDKVESLQLKLLDALMVIRSQSQLIEQISSERDRAIVQRDALRFSFTLEQQKPDDLSRN